MTSRLVCLCEGTSIVVVYCSLTHCFKKEWKRKGFILSDVNKATSHKAKARTFSTAQGQAKAKATTATLLPY